MGQFSLEIHFPQSRSKNYPDVIKHARLFFDFKENPNVLRITDVNELFGRWDDFSIVIFGATKWAGTNVFFCGSAVLPYKNDFFYTLLDIKHCYAGYQSSSDKFSHCSDSHWGCRRLTNILRLVQYQYATGRYWYKTGRFIDEKTWRVDKSQIIFNLLEETRKKMLNACPVFNQQIIENTVNELPDTITVDHHWTIEYQSEVGRSGVTRVPKSINHVQLSDDHIDQLNRENPEVLQEPDILDIPKKQKSPIDEIDTFLDDLLEQRKKKDSGKWEDISF